MYRKFFASRIVVTYWQYVRVTSFLRRTHNGFEISEQDGFERIRRVLPDRKRSLTKFTLGPQFLESTPELWSIRQSPYGRRLRTDASGKRFQWKLPR
jgi:hypothetical protein